MNARATPIVITLSDVGQVNANGLYPVELLKSGEWFYDNATLPGKKLKVTDKDLDEFEKNFKTGIKGFELPVVGTDGKQPVAPVNHEHTPWDENEVKAQLDEDPTKNPKNINGWLKDIETFKREDGKKALRGFLDFTDPEFRDYANKGKVKYVSCELNLNWHNPIDDKYYKVIEAVSTTAKPLIKGMQPIGAPVDPKTRKPVGISLSERASSSEIEHEGIILLSNREQAFQKTIDHNVVKLAATPGISQEDADIKAKAEADLWDQYSEAIKARAKELSTSDLENVIKETGPRSSFQRFGTGGWLMPDGSYLENAQHEIHMDTAVKVLQKALGGPLFDEIVHRAKTPVERPSPYNIMRDHLGAMRIGMLPNQSAYIEFHKLPEPEQVAKLQKVLPKGTIWDRQDQGSYSSSLESGNDANSLFDRISKNFAPRSHFATIRDSFLSEDADGHTINCTGDCVKGDHVKFDRATFTGSYKAPKFLGMETVYGHIINESYGRDKQQHTFTLKRPDGSTLLIKGRNLYRNGVMRKPWDNEDDRKNVAEEKHERGDAVRENRDRRRVLEDQNRTRLADPASVHLPSPSDKISVSYTPGKTYMRISPQTAKLSQDYDPNYDVSNPFPMNVGTFYNDHNSIDGLGRDMDVANALVGAAVSLGLDNITAAQISGEWADSDREPMQALLAELAFALDQDSDQQNNDQQNNDQQNKDQQNKDQIGGQQALPSDTAERILHEAEFSSMSVSDLPNQSNTFEPGQEPVSNISDVRSNDGSISGLLLSEPYALYEAVNKAALEFAAAHKFVQLSEHKPIVMHGFDNVDDSEPEDSEPEDSEPEDSESEDSEPDIDHGYTAAESALNDGVPSKHAWMGQSSYAAYRRPNNDRLGAHIELLNTSPFRHEDGFPTKSNAEALSNALHALHMSASDLRHVFLAHVPLQLRDDKVTGTGKALAGHDGAVYDGKRIVTGVSNEQPPESAVFRALDHAWGKQIFPNDPEADMSASGYRLNDISDDDYRNLAKDFTSLISDMRTHDRGDPKARNGMISMTPQGVFARFGKRFSDWTASGNREIPEDVARFVKLLQWKHYLDSRSNQVNETDHSI